MVGRSWTTPRGYSFFAQVILGVMVALTYTPGMFHNLGLVLAAIFGSTVVLSLVSIALSYLFFKLHILDLPTAYLATNPGAMSVLVPMANDLNMNVTYIAQFHLFRVIFIALTAPFVFKFLLR